VTGLKVEVKGAARLGRTARAAAAELRNLTAVNRAAATRIRNATSPPVRTGRLAASIQVLDAGPAEATVGSSLVYAPVIESGWAAHGIEARHFLQHAADSQSTACVGDYFAAVDDALAGVKGI
jgi:hypothetical protein